MKHMATSKLLAFRNVTEADATLKLLGICWLNVFESFKLVNKLAPLVELHHAFAQTCQIVNKIAQDVDWKRLSFDNYVEDLHVYQKVKRVKN